MERKDITNVSTGVEWEGGDGNLSQVLVGGQELGRVERYHKC